MSKLTEQQKAHKKAYNREYQRAYRARPENQERLRGYRRKDYARRGPKIREQTKKFIRKVKGIPLPVHPMPTVCECCGKPPRGRAFELVPDHCHATGKPRGWLCSVCNAALGMLGDDIIGVGQLLRYLLKYSAFAWMEGSL